MYNQQTAMTPYQYLVHKVKEYLDVELPKQYLDSLKEQQKVMSSR